MCDYSLEHYRSRPARVGERYVTEQFRSGSVGIASPDDLQTAVCMPYDARLRLTNIPAHVQKTFGLGAEAEGVFAEVPHHAYRDGVAFANGAALSLQRLGAGVTVWVTDLLQNEASPKVHGDLAHV